MTFVETLCEIVVDFSESIIPTTTITNEPKIKKSLAAAMKQNIIPYSIPDMQWVQFDFMYLKRYLICIACRSECDNSVFDGIITYYDTMVDKWYKSNYVFPIRFLQGYESQHLRVIMMPTNGSSHNCNVLHFVGPKRHIEVPLLENISIQKMWSIERLVWIGYSKKNTWKSASKCSILWKRFASQQNSCISCLPKDIVKYILLFVIQQPQSVIINST